MKKKGEERRETSQRNVRYPEKETAPERKERKRTSSKSEPKCPFPTYIAVPRTRSFSLTP